MFLTFTKQTFAIVLFMALTVHDMQKENGWILETYYIECFLKATAWVEKKKTFLRFLFLKKHIFQACKCEVVHFTSNNFSMMTMCNLHWVFTLGKKYFWGMERQWLQESPYRWGNPVTISIWLLLLPLSKQTTTCYCYTSALA